MFDNKTGSLDSLLAQAPRPTKELALAVAHELGLFTQDEYGWYFIHPDGESLHLGEEEATAGNIPSDCEFLIRSVDICLDRARQFLPGWEFTLHINNGTASAQFAKPGVAVVNKTHRVPAMAIMRALLAVVTLERGGTK